MTTTFAAATTVTSGWPRVVPCRPPGRVRHRRDQAERRLPAGLPGRAALAAAREAGSTHEHVIAAGAQYFRSPAVGPATIGTTVLRTGRTATQVAAAISPDGAPGVQAQFTLATPPAWR